jgi:ribosome-associated translation inhibitor RaiA
MQIHFTFRKVDEKSKEKLEKCFYSSKLKRLTRLLNHTDLELAILDIRAEYFAKHNAFSVKAEMNIKKRHFMGEEASHDIIKACDLALERLISQVRKAKNIKHKK